jgi:acetyltransferase-like isoleucine patch superfamily enzyme
MTLIKTLKPGTFSIEMTPDVVAALMAYGVQFSTSGANRFAENERIRFSSRTLVEPHSAFLTGDTLYSLGAYSYSASALPPRAQVGRYCSLGGGIEYLGGSHPLDFLSSSPFFYEQRKRLFTKTLADAGLEPRAVDTASLHRSLGVIAHDIWIGTGAMIGWNLTVGVGAVVAARAVVTKDVEPYAVVAGNPARVIRKRFPDPVIERLLASRWWDYSFTDFYDLPFTDPVRFLDDFEVRRDSGALKPLAPPRRLLDVLTELGFA